jgi:hypothetical protein
LGNGKDVRCQNTEFRIQTSHTHPLPVPGDFLNSEFCILTSDVFAVCMTLLAKRPPY